jgi:hypothetical protein
VKILLRWLSRPVTLQSSGLHMEKTVPRVRRRSLAEPVHASLCDRVHDAGNETPGLTDEAPLRGGVAVRRRKHAPHGSTNDLG